MRTGEHQLTRCCIGGLVAEWRYLDAPQARSQALEAQHQVCRHDQVALIIQPSRDSLALGVKHSRQECEAVKDDFFLMKTGSQGVRESANTTITRETGNL